MRALPYVLHSINVADPSQAHRLLLRHLNRDPESSVAAISKRVVLDMVAEGRANVAPHGHYAGLSRDGMTPAFCNQPSQSPKCQTSTHLSSAQ